LFSVTFGMNVYKFNHIPELCKDKQLVAQLILSITRRYIP